MPRRSWRVIGDVLGAEVLVTGFYAYGEISPTMGGGSALRNQTMTLTVISET